MRLAELDLKELLELDGEDGLLRFAGQRAVLLDAMSLGILRRQLAESFGMEATRLVLMRFGFAHGWGMAETMRHQIDWETKDDWMGAGPRLHALLGMFQGKPITPKASNGPLSERGATLVGSFEAEQHVLHLGSAERPVCWMLCGLVSGYLSCVTGREIYVLETQCTAMGAPHCQILGRTRQEWGERLSGELPCVRAGMSLEACLDASLHRVLDPIKRAESRRRQRKRSALAPEEAQAAPPGMVARSLAFRQVLDLAQRVGNVDSTVLITGETGVGKERIARLIHDTSKRREKAFVAINCAAIPEQLLESELFGHARGAFTGADQARSGLFEAAHGGTLLLDEVGELPLGMQAKLLRVLQERAIRRVGENASRSVDVRVLAATHRDLAHDVEAGQFRRDIYYRLKVVQLRVPPLRERQEDILPLARLLLSELAHRMACAVKKLTPEAADQLVRYGWPGNVRELENAMERALVLARHGRVEVHDLPEEIRHAVPSPLSMSAIRPLAQMERDYILAALALNGGNQARTAAHLGIGQVTLYRKLKRYRQGVSLEAPAGDKQERPPPRG